MPVGDAKAWTVDPFGGVIKDGYIWGRGTSDMKGAIAAFLAAALNFLETQKPQGSIGFLLTAMKKAPPSTARRKCSTG